MACAHLKGNLSVRKSDEAFAYRLQRKNLSKKNNVAVHTSRISTSSSLQCSPPLSQARDCLASSKRPCLPKFIYAYICNSYFRTFLTLFHAQGILNEQNGSGDMTKLYCWIDLSKNSMYQDDKSIKRELPLLVLNSIFLSFSLHD